MVRQLIEVTLECFTIEEFCRAHRVGRSTYYRLREEKRGPDECHLGGKVIITKEAAARWRMARENPEAIGRHDDDLRLFGQARFSPRFDRG